MIVSIWLFLSFFYYLRQLPGLLAGFMYGYPILYIDGLARDSYHGAAVRRILLLSQITRPAVNFNMSYNQGNDLKYSLDRHKII